MQILQIVNIVTDDGTVWCFSLSLCKFLLSCAFCFTLVVNVLAGNVVLGTGKTTTLLEYARLRPHLRFLLVVYNKSVNLL